MYKVIHHFYFNSSKYVKDGITLELVSVQLHTLDLQCTFSQVNFSLSKGEKNSLSSKNCKKWRHKMLFRINEKQSS